MIGLLHPGAMGAALGAALVAGGNEVAWASAGRSAATAQRAETAGLHDLETVDRLRRQCSTIVSICPPHLAVETVEQLAGFTGVYVDANAISPATATRIADLIGKGGGEFVDACVIGLPPAGPGQTRLYLSGQHAGQVRSLFTDGLFEAIVIDESAHAASALKMTFAAWTKISTALLLATAQTATVFGIGDALQAEWRLSHPALAERLENAQASAQQKGWRWVAEMQEIAATFASAGVPAEFGLGAAEIYRGYDRAAVTPAS